MLFWEVYVFVLVELNIMAHGPGSLFFQQTSESGEHCNGTCGHLVPYSDKWKTGLKNMVCHLVILFILVWHIRVLGRLLVITLAHCKAIYLQIMLFWDPDMGGLESHTFWAHEVKGHIPHRFVDSFNICCGYLPLHLPSDHWSTLILTMLSLSVLSGVCLISVLDRFLLYLLWSFGWPLVNPDSDHALPISVIWGMFDLCSGQVFIVFAVVRFS